MSTCRPTIHPFVLLTTAVLSGILATDSASAGCFNWLYGRPTTYSANYPYAAAPVTAVPPSYVNSGVVQAQRPAYVTPAPTTVQTFNNPSVYTGLPVTNSPVVSAQRLPISAPYIPSGSTPLPQTSYRAPTNAYNVAPAYNPAVVSGPAAVSTTPSYAQPLVTANRVPIASTLRGNASINPIVPAPTYTAYSPTGVAPVNYAAPATTAPPNALPLAAPQKSCFGCGLSRFFNSSLGGNTNYNTSYYRAPITYYRPMSSVNPTTGTTVTVQQPCSSYVQQLQRVPYNTLLPLQNTAVAPAQYTAPATSCPNPCMTPTTGPACPQPGYPPTIYPGTTSPSSIAPPAAPPIGPIGQTGGQFSPGTAGITTIPSTIPSTGSPTPAPLTGSSPATIAPPASNAADQDRVPQPRLEASRPDMSNTESGSSAENDLDRNNDPESYGDDIYPYGSPQTESEESLQAPPASNGPAIQLDPPVTLKQPGAAPNDPNSGFQQFTVRTPPSLQSPSPPENGNSVNRNTQFSTLRPIGVPDDVAAPLTNEASSVNAAPKPVVQPPSTEPFEPPPLPAPTNRGPDPSALFRNLESSASSRVPSQTRVSVPIREATTRHQNVRQVAAWEEVGPIVRPSPTAKPRRQTGGWLPAQ